MKRVFSTLFAVICLMSFAGHALACACCADPGTYLNRTVKPEVSTIQMLDEIKFDSKAWLFMSDAGFSVIQGLSEVEKEFETPPSEEATDFNFDLLNRFTKKSWKFTFKTPGGKTGTLTLPMPAR